MSVTFLVIGQGAREHALAVRLAASRSSPRVIVAPGNAGTAAQFENARLPNLCDARAVVALAKDVRADCVVIGPEAPLVDGVAEALRSAGLLVFGPSRDGARLEGSKAFLKQFAQRNQIRTAPFRLVSELNAAHAYVDEHARPLVVKADGLCAGKGVVVPVSVEDTHAAIDAMLRDRIFGDAGATLVLEDKLEGEELSVHVVTDGAGYVILPAAQDHKRLLDGDRGPNTGGMGAYAPCPLATPELMQRIEAEIVVPTLRGLQAEGISFRGVLFAGLMVTSDGAPWLLEYNVRFGDPETEVLMAVTDDDVAELLLATARGELHRTGIAHAHGHAACVVLAAEGYPKSPNTGMPISGIDAASEVEGVFVFHAGTRASDAGLVVSGGRVLAVTATGASLRVAVERAYEAAARISFEGMQYRSDIGQKGLRLACA